MTDRKPALKRYYLTGLVRSPLLPHEKGGLVRCSDLPPAILALTAPELRALAVFAEAMPELLRQAQKIEAEAHLGKQTLAKVDLRFMTNRITDAALAAAKETK